MQKLGLKGVQAKKFKRTTDSNHSKPVAPDLINQDFTAAAPNQKWASDLTYVWTDEGWLYLAVIMDLYSRAIIGWSMGKRMTQKLIKVMGFRCSMGRRATCYDNAAMESFFHTLKVEMIHREWYLTRPSAKRAIFEYIKVYYNRKRKYFAIGYQTPIQFEQKRA
jgi:transposase InsO family protein